MCCILIIDDDADLRNVLERALRKKNYQIITAVNGFEGIKLYQEHSVDLVITDIFMQYKNGIETIKELIQYDPQVKIIAVSGIARIDLNNLIGQDPAESLKAIGVMDFIPKPFDIDLLLKKVYKLLKH